MKRVLNFIPLTLLFISTGCEKEAASPEPAVPITSNWPATQRTDRGGFTVTMQPAGDSAIERNRHFSLEVAIGKATGTESSGSEQPAGGVEVFVDADMPAHRHGMNTKPELAETEKGKYRVDGMLFHMGGDWVITVDIKGEGGSERATFPVHVE